MPCNFNIEVIPSGTIIELALPYDVYGKYRHERVCVTGQGSYDEVVKKVKKFCDIWKQSEFYGFKEENLFSNLAYCPITRRLYKLHHDKSFVIVKHCEWLIKAKTDMRRFKLKNYKRADGVYRTYVAWTPYWEDTSYAKMKIDMLNRFPMSKRQKLKNAKRSIMRRMRRKRITKAEQDFFSTIIGAKKIAALMAK